MSDGLHTVGRWVRDRALSTPARVAVDDRGVGVTYAELDARSQRLAAALTAAGYGVGDRIATLTGNSADHVVLLFACAKAGLVLAPLSWRLSPREIAAQLDHADPALLVVEPEFDALADAAVERAARCVPRTASGAGAVEVAVPERGNARDGAPRDVVRRPVEDEDPLLLLFTSGTLGRPRAALLSHANCFWTNLSLSRTVDLTGQDVVLQVLPQFHVAGWNVQPLLAWWVGATVVLERTFDPGRALRLVAEKRVSTMMGVPTNYLLLAEHPDFARTDLSSLRQALVGGAPMPERLLRTWHRRGVALLQGYGLTEASPNVLCLPAEDARRMVGYAGTPYPHVDVAVADPATGQLLDGPARGELLVRGPGVFIGYWRDPEATAEAMRGGWLHTGDLVERDAAGYHRVVDRLTDVYISGGENIAPAEVEQVLYRHPGVAEAAVVGVPDPRWGEVGQAFVVRRPGVPVDEEALLAHCRAELARFKVPHRVVFVDALPRSAVDKVLKRELRARAEAP